MCISQTSQLMCKTYEVKEMPGHLSTREECTHCFTTFGLPFSLQTIGNACAEADKIVTFCTSVLMKISFSWYKCFYKFELRSKSYGFFHGTKFFITLPYPNYKNFSCFWLIYPSRRPPWLNQHEDGFPDGNISHVSMFQVFLEHLRTRNEVTPAVVSVL